MSEVLESRGKRLAHWAGKRLPWRRNDAADLDSSADDTDSSRYLKIGLIALVLYLVLMMVLGFLWDTEPDMFDVYERARQEAPGAQVEKTVGLATTSSLIGVVDTMLKKPGGFLSNDIFPPGVLMDNIPSWEFGVIVQSRDLTKALREAYSRSQSQSTEDRALSSAESRLNFSHQGWLLPSSEGLYGEGLEFLRDYLRRLSDEDRENAQFYARADNLRYWLGTVETRLGSLSQRLSASVGQRRLNLDLAGEPDARQSTASSNELKVKTPWLAIDNVFYEARGSAWALVHFLRAAEIDFADVLENKNARISLQQIIRELEQTQRTLYSPMVLNGSGFGMLANHSLVMASYISRANAAIIDLRELLSKG